MERTQAELINERDHKTGMFSKNNLLFDKIGFYNYGHWEGVNDSIEIAQINLIETLASFLIPIHGNIIDVGCGKGASSKFLTKYFSPEDITGVNISEKQLEVCRVIAPNCNFRLMDATNLDFTDASFSNILCMEAAPDFITRDQFLKEAHRVLKEGGKLAISDMFVSDESIIRRHGLFWPRENCFKDVLAYEERLIEIGFRYARVEDTTAFGIDAYLAFVSKAVEPRFDKESDIETHMHNRRTSRNHGITCCMAYAIK